MQNAIGIPSRIATAEELRELVPELEVAGVVGASVCAEDGYFDRPQSVVEAFAEAGLDLGIIYLPPPHTPADLHTVADVLAGI